MRVKLVPLDACTSEGKIGLTRLPSVLGRGADADVHLPDRWVSRRHCQIYEIAGTLFVRDLGSRHGTFVNDAHAPESHVMPGDKLTVGLTTFRVEYKVRCGIELYEPMEAALGS